MITGHAKISCVLLLLVVFAASSCSSVPFFGGSKPPLLQLIWSADDDANGGKSVKTMWMILTDTSVFAETKAAPMFRKEDYPDLLKDLEAASGQQNAPQGDWLQSIIVSAGNSGTRDWVLYNIGKVWKERPVFLCVIANFSNPPAGYSDRRIVRLNGKEKLLSVHMRVHKNSVSWSR